MTRAPGSRGRRVDAGTVAWCRRACTWRATRFDRVLFSSMTTIDPSRAAPSVPTEIGDPINARILAVSEDRIAGFLVDPFDEIARLAGLPLETVLERLRAMLAAGTIPRIRQTLMATNLAPGALVAWRVPNEQLDDAFDFLWREDPFSGHIVIRSTDGATPGSAYRLWTTLKVPQGHTIESHCELLAPRIGAEAFRAMPAK